MIGVGGETVSDMTRLEPGGLVRLPEAVLRLLGIAEGEELQVAVCGASLVLTPTRLATDGQRYFWCEEWQEGERQCDAGIAAGRVRECGSVDELIARLEEERRREGP